MIKEVWIVYDAKGDILVGNRSYSLCLKRWQYAPDAVGLKAIPDDKLSETAKKLLGHL